MLRQGKWSLLPFRIEYASCAPSFVLTKIVWMLRVEKALAEFYLFDSYMGDSCIWCHQFQRNLIGPWKEYRCKRLRRLRYLCRAMLLLIPIFGDYIIWNMPWKWCDSLNVIVSLAALQAGASTTDCCMAWSAKEENHRGWYGKFSVQKHNTATPD